MWIKFRNLIRTIEGNSIKWKARHGIMFLRISLGIVFIWFGALKFLPDLSAAESLAGKTILKLTFGFLEPAISMKILAVWECLIGLGLITKKFLSLTLLLLYFQMVGTLMPLILFPEMTFQGNLLVPTLLGQYIIKNFILISAGIVIGATAKGGVIIADHQVAVESKKLESIVIRYKRRFKKKPELKKHNQSQMRLM